MKKRGPKIDPCGTPCFTKANDDFELQNVKKKTTLLNKNIDYNRLARKIAITNPDGPVNRKIR